MEAVLLRNAWTNRSADIRAFENWVLCWLILPNFSYALLWLVGTPPRPWPILYTGFAGILLNRAPFLVKFLAFIASMMVSAVYFVSNLFNLSIKSLVTSLQFAAELSVTGSIEYVGAGIAIAVTLFTAWHLLQRSTDLIHLPRYAAAAALTVLVAQADVTMSAGAVGSYDRTPDASAPFTSAASASGFRHLATGERHLLFVMVEAMGEPSDPAVRRKLIDLFATPEVRARYEVTTGNSLFYGSTTNGEMRELCGQWGDYDRVLERNDPDCLPAQLKAAGYQTQAWHSFKGTMFSRTRWYPNIGFETMRWGPDMVSDGAEKCPGVFVGACDRDVPRQIAAQFKRANRPQFLYWLTVNSHLPVLKSDQLHTQDCRRFDPALDESLPMTCRLLQLFGEIGHSLAREISAPDFPATDILIVGDHLPPFFDRKNREQFEPDRVPWILLRPKGNS